MITINSYADISRKLALSLIEKLEPKLAKAIALGTPISEEFSSCTQFKLLHQHLESPNPLILTIDGSEVEFVYGTQESFSITEQIESVTDATELIKAMDTDPAISHYNLYESDKNEILKKTAVLARAMLKKYCIAFDLGLHSSFMRDHKVAVETSFNRGEFGLVGYYETSAAGEKVKPLILNSDRYKANMKKENSLLLKSSNKCLVLEERVNVLKDSAYKEDILNDVDAVLQSIPDISRQLNTFMSNFAAIKNSNGAIEFKEDKIEEFQGFGTEEREVEIERDDNSVFENSDDSTSEE